MEDSQSDSDETANPSVCIQALIDQHQVKIWRYLRALGCDENLADDFDSGYICCHPEKAL